MRGQWLFILENGDMEASGTHTKSSQWLVLVIRKQPSDGQRPAKLKEFRQQQPEPGITVDGYYYK